jgi:hypothetical protein
LKDPKAVVDTTMKEGSHVMRKTGRTVLTIAGILLSAAGLADGVQSFNVDSQRASTTTSSLETLLAKLEHASPWQLVISDDAVAYADDRTRPIANFRFEDASALARVGKLRSLSLLTLAETGRTRLYVGVNASGLLGLHLSGFRRDDEDRYLEVARLPYLKDGESVTPIEWSAPGPN